MCGVCISHPMEVLVCGVCISHPMETSLSASCGNTVLFPPSFCYPHKFGSQFLVEDGLASSHQLFFYPPPHLPSSREHLSFGDCLVVRRENNQNCSVLYCVQQLRTMIRTHTREQLLNLHVV